MPERLIVEGNTLRFGQQRLRCAYGKGGFVTTEKKQEGDGGTPIGTWALRECWFRPDRITSPATALPLRAITRKDGWCDAPADAAYNTHVELPYPARHETLWREDHVYDVIVPLGYNDRPIIPGKGSAIFLHLAKPDYAPTEGCIAIAREDMLMLLPQLSAQTVMEIRGR